MKLHRWDDIKARHITPERAARIEAEVMAELRARRPRWLIWARNGWLLLLAACWVVVFILAGQVVFGAKGPLPVPHQLPCGASAPLCPARHGLDGGAW